MGDRFKRDRRHRTGRETIVNTENTVVNDAEGERRRLKS